MSASVLPVTVLPVPAFAVSKLAAPVQLTLSPLSTPLSVQLDPHAWVTLMQATFSHDAGVPAK